MLVRNAGFGTDSGNELQSSLMTYAVRAGIAMLDGLSAITRKAMFCRRVSKFCLCKQFCEA